jgi:hypothetical protein
MNEFVGEVGATAEARKAAKKKVVMCCSLLTGRGRTSAAAGTGIAAGRPNEQHSTIKRGQWCDKKLHSRNRNDLGSHRKGSQQRAMTPRRQGRVLAQSRSLLTTSGVIVTTRNLS